MNLLFRHISSLQGMILLIFLLTSGFSEAKSTKTPRVFDSYIKSITYDKIGNNSAKIEYTKVSDRIYKVNLNFFLSDTIHQDDWKVTITPAFKNVFNWAPHLTPADGDIIAQHVFRSPALIVSSEVKQLIIIPDLSLIKEDNPAGWYMDMNARDNTLTLGRSKASPKKGHHVLFTKNSGAIYPPGKIEYGFYVMMTDDKSKIFNPWREIAAFHWKNGGEGAFKTMIASHPDLESYVKHTYNWAFNTWKKSMWQEFTLNETLVGAPVFIVNTTQSPNYPGEINEREFRSVWNQAWFNSMRSASGLFRYAKRQNDPKLLEYALKTKELALQFPQKEGFFYGLIATKMKTVVDAGSKYNRSEGWDTYYFGNSNRNPYTRNPRHSPFHILDMSFTAFQMLTWYNELEPDKRLLDYSIRFADALIKKQAENGFYPAWLDLNTLEPMEHLNESPESSMSVTFLIELYKITKNKAYLKSALKAMDAIIEKIIPIGQWEDFETYWSCSDIGNETNVGKKFARNNQFKQNSFSMYWTAEALLECYKITGDSKYLSYGERTLDELLMYQQTWEPPFIYVKAIGGFGVMNADGEWNDARQSLFSELIVRYGMELKREEYIQRGLSALYASFYMMYCPENADIKGQWETVWPFFNHKDYGFMMENYGHGGTTGPQGIGIGEFTIYDWGNGAAAEAYNRIIDRYGKSLIEKYKK